ncbi:winged helix-turn-helix domain-containing protein [Nonomuraea sp. K274]|uniref:Winged helix-turn-helix domain-containing protein n=1 Tax=Nonomuraea cypriaca TaxID=1187855 RepID=A0A931AHU8_9ACTN|nr:AfsR/SARP family transcriptional regulator [Nonomuraea cypriaca]MBF8191925.1 winged helix-turn-helix domain-containing protein [Nonomuraea cypriaca]
MSFRILGPLAVIHEGRDITPTAPKVRQVLAFLLVRKGQIVQISEFIDELWGDQPPESAMTTLQTYIYKLRKEVLDPSGLARLHTQQCGYLLEVPDERVDVGVFEQAAKEGRQLLERGDAQRAGELLSEALSVWRGQALLGVTTGEILSAHVTRLEENRLRALEMHIEADMHLGRYRELISELKTLVHDYPLHERFYGDLMTALNRSGRRYEALEVYRRLRKVLIDELGLEPSAALQRLHQSLLSADTPKPAGNPPTGGQGGGQAGAATRPPAVLTVPAQLPPDISDFTGRVAPMARLTEVLTAPQSTTTRTLSITGMGGVGKTTLALHVAHLNRARFPDGQLFADLHGASATPTAPADVLAGFLRSVGVPDHQIPPTLEERSSLFRTWSNDRRLLVVLDNASEAAQVTALLPAAPQCVVIVTSREGLQSMPGVTSVELGVMSLAEGTQLLGRVIGAERVAAEPEYAEKIVDLCGRLPRALRCVGSRLAAARVWSLQKMAALIESCPTPLDQLRFADFDVRADYDHAYFRLEPHDRSMLRLLSLLPPQDFTAVTAAGLLGNATDAVEARLTRLAGCHLLDVRSDDAGSIRYGMHRLTRLYARERLNREYLQPED